MTAFATAYDFDTSPYFETLAREFYRNFGDDALGVVDRAIEAMEEKADAKVEEALEIWREIRLTLLRKSPDASTVTIQ